MSQRIQMLALTVVFHWFKPMSTHQVLYIDTIILFHVNHTWIGFRKVEILCYSPAPHFFFLKAIAITAAVIFKKFDPAVQAASLLESDQATSALAFSVSCTLLSPLSPDYHFTARATHCPQPPNLRQDHFDQPGPSFSGYHRKALVDVVAASGSSWRRLGWLLQRVALLAALQAHFDLTALSHPCASSLQLPASTLSL